MTDNAEKEEQPARLGYGPVAAVLVTAGSYVGSDVIAGLLLGAVATIFFGPASESKNWLDTSVVAQFLTVLFITMSMLGLIGVFLNSRKIAWTKLGLALPRSRDIWYALAGYAAYFVAFIIISQIVVAFIPGLDIEQEQDLLFDRQTTGPALWLIFGSLVVLPAIVEEIIFRGFLYSGLRRRWPKLLAAIVTSILFAVAHLQIGSGNALLWIAALDTWVLSMILVALREKTGSLAAPMMVHFIKNSLAFVFLFLFPTTL